MEKKEKEPAEAKKKNKKEEAKDKTDEENKDETSEKKEILYFLVPVIIIIIILGAIFGLKYIYKPKTSYETVTYRGFIFVNVGENMWSTQIQRGDNLYTAMFKYNPYEVENITVNYLPNNFTKITKQQDKLYITFDPDSVNLGYIGTASADVSTVLAKVFNIQAMPACTKNITGGCANRPIQTCSSTGRIVIYVKDDPVQNVTYSGNCLTIQGYKEDLLKASTRVIMGWYGIIQTE